MYRAHGDETMPRVSVGPLDRNASLFATRQTAVLGTLHSRTVVVIASCSRIPNLCAALSHKNMTYCIR